MSRAIRAVENNEMGWLKAATQFGVPQATLRRRCKNGKNKIVQGSNKGLGRYQTTFNACIEKELIDHVKLLESRLFGLLATDLRRLAYQIAERYNLEF